MSTLPHPDTHTDVFFYDGKPDDSGNYLVIVADGQELPGWYYFSGEEPQGPWDTEEEATLERSKEFAPKPTWWSVAVFMCDRAYGGPEEGGWWYDYGYPVKDSEVAPLMRVFSDKNGGHAAAMEYRRQLQIGLNIFMNAGRIPITSVLSDGEYRAVITDDDYPKAYPAERPRYE